MIKKESAKRMDGKEICYYRFENKNGLQMIATNYGATITKLKVPDRRGGFANVVLGFDSVEPYINGSTYFGCTVGRYANRIAGARFSLNGTEYHLTKNENDNQLHGGKKGFNKQIWDGGIKGDALELTYISLDGEEGYPGAVTAKVIFQLTGDDALDIAYFAQSDADTVINLTNHSFFNLSGAAGTILDHELQIDADAFTPTDDTLIPTGECRNVQGTPMDFRTPHKVGERIFDKEYDAIKLGQGYDHNYVLNGTGMRKIAEVYDADSGRVMRVETDQPAVQLYTGQMIEDGIQGAGGKIYGPFYGLCLETQVHPDAPNQPGFPSAVLKKGETYTHHTRYVFSIK